MLKTTHSSDTELGGIELEMILKSPHWWVALIVSETAILTAKGEKLLVALPSRMPANHKANNVVG